jgi:hypothetical protein
MKPREIHVHIEELVLHGFPNGSRHLVGSGIESRLSALLSEHGVPTSWQASTERINGGTVYSHSPTHPALAGEQIARAVHGAPSP